MIAYGLVVDTAVGGGVWTRDVEGASFNSVGIKTANRLLTFASRARRKNDARQTRMRINGCVRVVSATHHGDLRVGCTLIPYDVWSNHSNQIARAAR